MKKLFALSAILLLNLITFTSCETTKIEYAVVDVQYYTISQWALSGDKRYFFAQVACSSITQDIFFNGAVNGYYITGYQTPYEAHIPLPHDIYQSGVDTQGNTIFWTETASMDIIQNGIIFYYEASDFYTGTIPPPCAFKIVVMR